MPLSIQNRSQFHRLWSKTTQPVTRIVKGLAQRVHSLVMEWRKFRKSFYFPSSIETKKRSLAHDKIRRRPWPELHFAAAQGRTYYVESLLKKRHGVNDKDCEKVTPLHCAIRGRNPDTILTLLAAGADIHAADFRGQTPLYWAAYHGTGFAIPLLIKLGANVNQADLRGKTPLRAAAKKGNVPSALLAAGANVNAQDSKKQTPFYCASLHGRISTMNILRLYGADSSIVNVDGKTAKQVIARSSFWTYLRHRWQVYRGHYRNLTNGQIQALRVKLPR
ncbi:MAG: ankyrin repeat domain-containing protein [Parachlamydia sp.]|nr:ankyrin repeat domain-containing protein [Parachlamydia sp.]